MILNRIQHPLRNLGASPFVEEHRTWLIVQSGELIAYPADRKYRGKSPRFRR